MDNETEPLQAAGGESEGPTLMPNIEIHRKPIKLSEGDYGHWWTKLGSIDESYGWWPKKKVSFDENGKPVKVTKKIWNTLGGVEGELNGQTSFKGKPTKDPYHNLRGKEVLGVQYTGSDEKSEATIMQEMKQFANGYSGNWRWTFGFGQNCHTFQEEMLENSDLEIVKDKKK